MALRILAGRLVNTAISVGTTAIALPTTAANGRITMSVHNAGSVIVYVGGASVTTANGLPLEVGEKLAFDLDANVVLYGVVASGTADVRILEGA